MGVLTALTSTTPLRGQAPGGPSERLNQALIDHYCSTTCRALIESKLTLNKACRFASEMMSLMISVQYFRGSVDYKQSFGPQGVFKDLKNVRQ